MRHPKITQKKIKEMEQHPPEIPFAKGLVDLGGGYTFLSGSTELGLANAGLVVSDDEALVVDTLYDLQHAQEFLDAITPVTASAPVRYVFNTHSDGDHIFGNQLFPADAEVIATNAANALITQDQADLTAWAFDESQRPESRLHSLAGLGRPFDFHPVRVRSADVGFSGEKTLQIGALEVQLHELGPAHTVGDAIAYIPEKKVLFAGDLPTRDIVKVIWSGSVANWITALDKIREFDAEVVIAGHGPVLSGGAITAALEAGHSVLVIPVRTRRHAVRSGDSRRRSRGPNRRRQLSRRRVHAPDTRHRDLPRPEPRSRLQNNARNLRVHGNPGHTARASVHGKLRFTS